MTAYLFRCWCYRVAQNGNMEGYWLLFLPTNATLVCVSSDTKLFVRQLTDMSATVTPIGGKFCMIVHIGIGVFFFVLGGGTSKGSQKSQILGLNFVHFTVNISKTVSRDVAWQLELNISSSGSFEKCIAWGCSAPRKPLKAKYVTFWAFFQHRQLWSLQLCNGSRSHQHTISEANVVCEKIFLKM